MNELIRWLIHNRIWFVFHKNYLLGKGFIISIEKPQML